MNPTNPPLPPRPTAGQRDLSQLQASDISIPELDRKIALEKEAKIKAAQQANPQAPNQQGLNASGLPSPQAYYAGKKKSPVHTSVITPICESRLWIKVLAGGALCMAFFWIKFSIDGMRFNHGTGAFVHHLIRLVLTYFLFVKPAHMLFFLTKDIDALENCREEEEIAKVLYAHAEIWKHLGYVVIGLVVFSFMSMLGGTLTGLFQLN